MLIKLPIKIIFAVSSCLSLMWFSSAHALRLEEPYNAEIPVATQSAAERPAAERAGLLLVLERLSGQRLDSDPHIKLALSKAENYLQQFAYLQAKPLSPDAQPEWKIKLVFSPAAVNQLLSDASVTMWPLDRPQVMLLMVNEQTALLPLPGRAGEDVVAPLIRMGQARGVPLLLLGDASAQDITMVAAVQSLDAASVMQQTTHLKPDALLLGNVAGNDTAGWRGQWLLRYQGKDQSFEKKSATYNALIDDVLREAAQYLSSAYRDSTTADTGAAQLQLQVEGIKSYADFTALREFIEKLEAVQRVGNMHLNGSSVTVDVDVKGRESFRNLMNLSKSLRWQDEVLPPAGSDPSLRPLWRYQWMNN